jgi:hypothetical protein
VFFSVFLTLVVVITATAYPFTRSTLTADNASEATYHDPDKHTYWTKKKQPSQS